jgi:peptide deformylase
MVDTLSLRYWPDPVLNKKCAEVPEVTDEIRAVAKGMLDIMYKQGGIGLAAPQVGRLIRMIVVDVWWPKTGARNPRVFINPLLTLGEEKERAREGCLSLPGITDFVTRSKSVQVHALDEHGKPVMQHADGLLAVCLQHECEHLDGITLVEHMGRANRRILKKQMQSKRPPRPV